MPKIIYTGDIVEIRYIFQSEESLFSGDFENQSASLVLRTDYSIFLAKADDFFVKSANLEKSGSQYTLSLSIIPWKTGFISFPRFNLSSLVAFSQNKEFSGISTPVIISLSQIEVKSLAQKTKSHSFLPQSSPLVMPGTTAFLIFLALSALFLFFLMMYALLRLPKIAGMVRNLSYLYSLKKKSRKTIKKLLNLQKKSVSSNDKDFAHEVQHILRAFLTNRFSTDFFSVTSSTMYQVFSELLGYSLSEHQETTIENLLSIFNRLDYVRYAENAHFLSEQENSGTNEKAAILQSAIHVVEGFDTERKGAE